MKTQNSIVVYKGTLFSGIIVILSISVSGDQSLRVKAVSQSHLDGEVVGFDSE